MVTFDSTYYTPRQMFPAPPVFPLSTRLKKELAAHLRKAFELLWVDPASCANRIRVFLEFLMDHFEILRTDINAKGEEYDLKLYHRIERLEAKKPGHKKTFNALRNVGNYASHSGKAKFETLIDCFELVELIIADLVDGRQDRLDKMTARLSVKDGEF
ncbi:DUF4145 domain-containing protein [Mesorhizobium loti R88b]|uniref:DUF4145 domain-containing protein n=2 Tax=Rhizobium loti TaxID=381 RepID=A0A6M7WHR4_RHILI|nr:DUF4145 domain-containing protein [Mesorhizobium loti R88b]